MVRAVADRQVRCNLEPTMANPTWRPPSRGPFTPRHGLDGFLGKLALGLSIASNDPSNVIARAECCGFNEKVVSRAVLELDDELPVSVCCHWTFLIRADLNRPTVAYLHLPVIVSYGRSGLNRAAN
jgi:hypothetical protein